MAERAAPTSASRAGPSGPPGDLLDTLAERIQALAERHRATRSRVEELRARLAERDLTIAELEKRIAGARRVQRDIGRRLDGLISQVARLEGSAANGRDSV
ncbi:MAG: hypothetical protein ACE5FG_08905 [Myxococcota bacterium]